MLIWWIGFSDVVLVGCFVVDVLGVDCVCVSVLKLRLVRFRFVSVEFRIRWWWVFMVLGMICFLLLIV